MDVLDTLFIWFEILPAKVLIVHSCVFFEEAKHHCHPWIGTQSEFIFSFLLFFYQLRTISLSLSIFSSLTRMSRKFIGKISEKQKNTISEANTRCFDVDVVENTFVSLDGEALSLRKNKTKKTIKEKRTG